jgi:hypothetical protein
MLYLTGLVFALALPIVLPLGCADVVNPNGTGGTGGIGGAGGTAGTGGVGGDGGAGGGAAGSGGTTGAEFPCTAQGIRNAIAEGGGPHTFACDGPTIVETSAVIEVDNDVILDGGGNLVVHGARDQTTRHRVFFVQQTVTAELIGMTVSEGEPSQAGESGGGVFNEGTLDIVGSTITQNGTSTTDRGGGVGNTGTLRLIDSVVSENTAFIGCGISNDDGSLTLINTRVTGNGGGTADIQSGSGINNGPLGSLTLIDSTVSGNSDGFGDAHAITNTGTMLMVKSTVSENQSTQSAGIWNGGSATLVNSTVSGNNGQDTSAIEGGGMSPFLALYNTTLVPGGGSQHLFTILLREGEFVSTNSVIVGPDGGLGACSLQNVTVTSGGYNIEATSNTCGLQGLGDRAGMSASDLALGPLQNNGGPTQTHALKTESEAINHIPEGRCLDQEGEALSTDQRGEPRPETGGAMCDAGAFERQPDDQ